MSKQSSGRLAWYLVFGSVLGVAIGCKGTKHPDGWFDACCATCSEGHCSDCNQTKADCGGDETKAECLHDGESVMCREKLESRH